MSPWTRIRGTLFSRVFLTLSGLGLALSLTWVPDLQAQDPEASRANQDARPGDTVWVTPRSRFDANFIQRLFLGEGYRDLWALPFQAEVLDLSLFAGGLTPTQRGGGLQTPSIRLQSEEGPVYTFRSLDKDAARALDPELRGSITAVLAQDFVSAVLPLGALILDRLQEAAGVLHATPQLALMPDDPRLGEFRGDFAGVLGWIEVRADEGPDGEPGFAGAVDVKGSEPFMEDLEESPRNRVDSRAYLKARLLDALVGDWDRHPDQWRWAGFMEGEELRFHPVPRDRDWALTKLDGVKMWVSKIPWPHYVGFDHEFPSAFRLTWSGRVLDRRVLPDLDWEDWVPVAEELVQSLPDTIIEEAVLRLPPPHFQVVGPEITASLKNRRDHLLELARDFYLLQAEAVDIRATDEDELAVLERLPGDGLRVTIFQIGPEGTGSEPYFQREFTSSETQEVRVYLHGGDDEARVQGVEDGSIRIFIVGGGGDDHLAVSGGGRGDRVEFFDHRGDNLFEPGPSTRIDENSYSDPADWREDSHWAGTRDWGSRTVTVPSLVFEGDGGLVVGGSLIRTGYGFRQYPHRDRTRFTVGYGAKTQKPHIEAEIEFPVSGQTIQGRLHALASGTTVHRFYGFGNETTSDQELEAYQAFSTQYQVAGAAIWRVSPGLAVEAGTALSISDPTENAQTLLSTEAPYGFERFTSVALTGGLKWDGRDNAAWPTRGTTLEVSGGFFPAMGSVETRFGKARAVGSAYLSASEAPLEPTLALQIGGEKIWGDFPYHEAALLGGSRGLRGFPEERFSGDASVHLGSELRLHLGTLPAILPGSWGITAAGETGRVWFHGEDSDRWRNSFGGGVWASIIDTFTLTVSLARSDEGTRFLYGGGGFHF